MNQKMVSIGIGAGASAAPPRGRSGNDHVASLLAVGSVLSCLLGCAIRLPEIEVRPPAAYPGFRDVQGLRVAADPYFAKERVRRAFGTDLLSQGVLPVLVVLENGTDSVFSIQKDGIALVQDGVVDEGGTVPPDAPPKKRNLTPLEQAGLVVGSLVVVASPAVGLVLVAGAAFSEHSDANRARIRNHMLVSELSDRTVYPRESTRGFVYFRHGFTDPTSGGLFALRADVENLSDHTTWEIVVPLKPAVEGGQ